MFYLPRAPAEPVSSWIAAGGDSPAAFFAHSALGYPPFLMQAQVAPFPFGSLVPKMRNSGEKTGQGCLPVLICLGWTHRFAFFCMEIQQQLCVYCLYISSMVVIETQWANASPVTHDRLVPERTAKAKWMHSKWPPSNTARYSACSLRSDSM